MSPAPLPMRDRSRVLGRGRRARRRRHRRSRSATWSRSSRCGRAARARPAPRAIPTCAPRSSATVSADRAAGSRESTVVRERMAAHAPRGTRSPCTARWSSRCRSRTAACCAPSRRPADDGSRVRGRPDRDRCVPRPACARRRRRHGGRARRRASRRRRRARCRTGARPDGDRRRGRRARAHRRCRRPRRGGRRRGAGLVHRRARGRRAGADGSSPSLPTWSRCRTTRPT